jgi:CubicO group peptidase (beta-lactamase class C family)
LIVSDALEMTGARTTGWDGSNVVDSVAAGVDLLLVPPRPEVALQALRRAVQVGELTRERIDASVRRILHAKAWLAEASAQTGGDIALQDSLSSLDAQLAARQVADNSLTLLKNPKAAGTLSPLLPLASFEPPDVVLMVLDSDRASSSRALSPLERALRRRARSLRTLVLTPDTTAARLPRVGDLLAEARGSSGNAGNEPVVVVAHRAHHMRASFPQVESFLFEHHGGPIVALSLGDPWNLVEFGSGDGVAPPEGREWAALAAYDSSEVSQQALAAALFGERAITGTTPVSLSPEWQRGAGIELPAQVGRLDPGPRSLPRVEKVLADAVAGGTTPGAVVLVGQGQELLFEAAFGRESYDADAAPVTLETRFDLASLTKVIVTTTLVMHHVETGALSLDSPAALFVPEFVDDGVADKELKATITIRDLLTHASGMLWWTDLWARHGVAPSARPVPAQAIAQARQAYLNEIVQLPLVDPPGVKTVYSDLGLLLLGEIVERAGGAPLDQQAQSLIFEPLGMTATGYRSRNSPASFDTSGVAPTELDPQWRGRVVAGPVHGLVHDENAYGLGGVAAHAGLFSTAGDLGRFARMLLSGGVFEGQRLLNGDTIARFTRPALRVEGSSRALGWDTPSGERSSAGNYFSARSFGHTGFTGTSMWMDPERDLFVVLLTNRVHPTRDNNQIRDLRIDLHDAIVLDLEGEGAVRREVVASSEN